MIFNVNSGAGKIPINAVPNANSSFTYDGTTKTPLWQNYDPEQLSISGNTAGTDAGTYKVYFTPKADYEWSDGTSTPREVTWSIAKAEGFLTLSATSGTIEGKKNTKSFTVNYNGDGKISVKSGNTAIATVAISGTTVTVTSVAYGSATITVSAGEGTNHTAPSNVTYAVKVDYLYLYNLGAQKSLKAYAYKDSDSESTAKAPSVTKGTSTTKLSLTGTADVGYAGAYFAEDAIDLTNYSKINVQVTATTIPEYASIRTVVTTRKANNFPVTARVHLDTTGKIALDVSSLKGKYYVCIELAGVNEKSITFSKWWLE